MSQFLEIPACQKHQRVYYKGKWKPGKSVCADPQSHGFLLRIVGCDKCKKPFRKVCVKHKLVVSQSGGPWHSSPLTIESIQKGVEKNYFETLCPQCRNQ